MAIPHSLDFDGPNAGRSFVQDLQRSIANGLAHRALDTQAGADGRRWQDNSPKYARSRRKAGKHVGVLSGEMLSPRQLMGEPEVTRNTFDLVYGTNEATRERLDRFTKGRRGRRRQPARPGVYELDERLIREYIDPVIADHLDHFLDSQ